MFFFLVWIGSPNIDAFYLRHALARHASVPQNRHSLSLALFRVFQTSYVHKPQLELGHPHRDICESYTFHRWIWVDLVLSFRQKSISKPTALKKNVADSDSF